MNAPETSTFVDDQREWHRIDDRLLLEYRLAGEPATSAEASFSQQETADAITTFITKSTQDLLAHDQLSEHELLLVPWLRKIDWVLELMLHKLSRLSGEGLAVPRMTDVTISGGGISFTAMRGFQVGDHLDLRLILPPFTPIQAVAEVTGVRPLHGHAHACRLAAQFIAISADDRERLIRHILHRQAERLRTRHSIERE